MTKLERNIVYSLPLISICFEIAKSFITGDTPIMAIRDYSFFLIILFLIVKYFKLAAQLNVYLLIVVVYFSVLILLGDINPEQLSHYVRFFNGKMLFPLGFILTSSFDHFKVLNKRLLITNILFVVSIIIFTIFGIGINQYGGDSSFKTGAFIHSLIYTGSFLLILIPIFYKDLRTKIAKNALTLLGMATLVVLILSVRRTALVIVLIGAVVYMFLNKNHFPRIALNGIMLLVVLFVSYPLYKDPLEKQIQARGDVFNDRKVSENLQEETRFAETIAVYNERILNPDLRVLLFGQYLFDSGGKYAGGVHKDRPLHLDTNVILHGSGLVGLILYLLSYLQIFMKYSVLKTRLDTRIDKNLTAAFLGIYLSLLFLLISGGMTTITFNLIAFLYMGAILGLYRSALAGTLKPMSSDRSLSDTVVSSNGRLISRPKPYIYEVYNSRKAEYK
jgi:hypothetical protein